MVRAEQSSSGRVRCAIYTRKSSEEGLEQEFNSLHAQREACEAYIASQRHEGWKALSGQYDDGGFSGGTMERPALKRLLTDIANGKVDIVVVYKIDRLTRSLFDFAKIVEIFDAKQVSFVSVTQAFNTTTSMGRLTLNVLLSFAQFEREVTSERIRDKIAASKRKGMWMGGAVPLGYDVVHRKLKINREEAELVRQLYALYLELGSVRALKEECDRLGLRTKSRTYSDGRKVGGGAFSRGHLYRILANPLYIGRIPHGDRSYEGEHEAILDRETWDKVQALLVENAGRKRGRRNAAHPSLLAGLLFTADGVPLTASHTVNHCRRYRYYVEQRGSKSAGKSGGGFEGEQRPGDNGSRTWRLPAHQIEQLVLTQLSGFLQDRAALLEALATTHRSIDTVSPALDRGSSLANELQSAPPAQQAEIVQELVNRVAVAADMVAIEMDREGLRSQLMGSGGASETNDGPPELICIDVPVKFRRRGVETKLVVGGKQVAARSPDPSLVKLLARAHAWFDMIVSGEVHSFDEIARMEGVDRSYVSRVTCLAFIGPDPVQSVVRGSQPGDLTMKKLTAPRTNIPLLWQKPCEPQAD
jgi:DNA invertase Pin-like site-specific DNA recombinase